MNLPSRLNPPIASSLRTFGGPLAITTCLMLCVAGCSVDGTGASDGAEASDETNLDVDEPPVPFASFETEDGSTVQFFEPEAGELLVTSISKIDNPAHELDQPAALYEKLAGEPLPERFDAALEQLDHSHEVGPAEFDSGSPATPGSSLKYITREDLSTQEFAEKYCDRGDVRLWCWLERTNTSYFSQRLSNMDAYAHSYRGSITHRLRRKNTWGNWKTLYSVTVPAGYSSKAFNLTSVPYTHESRVYDASGDGYHHSGGYYRL